MSDSTTSLPIQPDDAPQPHAEGRRVVVVLGSGRSGTSLCAKILGQLGIRMEVTLQRPNEMNPEGYFEDAQLHDLNRRMLERVAAVDGLGPRSDYQRSLIAAEQRELKNHLSERAFAEPTTWGFKHPRTSLLLPIYRRAFQALGIVPRYVFCARDPGAIAESLHEATGNPLDFCEQVYFVRSFLALRDCAANCHVVHYERLLADPVEQVERLWRHVGDEGTPVPLSPEERAALVDPGLNRSGLRARAVSNPLAARIGALLDGMEGTAFDRDAVRAELREIDAIHAGYGLWLGRAARATEAVEAKAKALEKQVERLKARDARRQDAEGRPDDALPHSEGSAGRVAERLELLRDGLEDARHAAERRSERVAGDVATLRKEVGAMRRRAEAEAARLRGKIEALRSDLLEARAASGRAAEAATAAEAAAASRAAQAEGERDALARSREEAVTLAGHQEACAAALAAELSLLQARAARLEEERNAAIAHARSVASGLKDASAREEKMRIKLEEPTKARGRLSLSEAKLREEHEALKAEQESLRIGHERLEADHERLKARNKKRRTEHEALKVEHEKRRAELRRAQAEIVLIKASKRYQAAGALAEAARRPGWATLTLPWRLARIRQAGGAPRDLDGKAGARVGGVPDGRPAGKPDGDSGGSAG